MSRARSIAFRRGGTATARFTKYGSARVEAVNGHRAELELCVIYAVTLTSVSSAEIQRLKKRFMKLDRDGSGSIDRDEFLQIPAIANNPLAHRLISIFDEECVWRGMSCSPAAVAGRSTSRSLCAGSVLSAAMAAAKRSFTVRVSTLRRLRAVAFKVYDMDRDGFISNGELFLVLKMMVGGNLKDQQLQQIVDKTILEADKNGDGKLDFSEFMHMVNNTEIAKQLTLEVRASAPHLTDARTYSRRESPLTPAELGPSAWWRPAVCAAFLRPR